MVILDDDGCGCAGLASQTIFDEARLQMMMGAWRLRRQLLVVHVTPRGFRAERHRHQTSAIVGQTGFHLHAG